MNRSVICSLIVFLLFFELGHAQSQNNKYEDSLKKYIFKNPDKTIVFSKGYLEYSKKKKLTDKIILSYGCLTLAYDMKNEIDSVVHYSYEALSYCKDPKDVIRFKLDLCEVYENGQNNKKALELLQECFDLAKKNKLKEEEQTIAESIDFLRYKIFNPAKDLKLRIEDYEKAKASKEEKNIRYTRLYLIQAYLDNENPNEALKFITEGLMDAKDRNNFKFLYEFYKMKAEAHLQLEEIAFAHKAIKKAQEKAVALNNREYIDEVDYVLAVINGKNERYEDLVLLLEEVLRRNRKHTPEQLSKYYKLLASGYKNLGNNELSILYYEKYDIENKKVEKNKIVSLGTTHILAENSTALKTEEQKRKKTHWIVAFMVLFVFLMLVFYRNKRIQKRNKESFNELMIKIKTFEEDKIVIEQPLISNENEVVIEDDSKSNEDSNYTIDDEKVNEILTKLQKLEEQKYFLRQDCTLHNMAKRLKTNTTYLSKIVNTHLNKSFSVYINELRINYAIIELKRNKQLRAYSTKAIAQELGYKKAGSFSKYFKEATGITPAVYIKEIRNLS